MKKTVSLLLVLLLLCSLALPALAEGEEGVELLTQPLDYDDAANWAYFGLGEDRRVDVFLICPTVDTRSYPNALDLNDKLKGRFISALDMEEGIYADTGRLFSPYYRQMSINAYALSEPERARAEANAYLDVSAAFRWYLDHENGGRPIILAGFSQGSQMCLKLLEEYYGEGAEAAALRQRLVAVYAVGWGFTEELTARCPQIVPARGETDTGVVVSFDCEAEGVTGTIIIPEGVTVYAINPLNWRTDGTPADRSLNLGAVMGTGAEPVPGLCGAYVGDRGQLVTTDVLPEDYPPALDVFPEGAYHVYDYMFFFTNLRRNVADRTAAYFSGVPFKDLPADEGQAEAVKYVYDRGLMNGTGAAVFSPDLALTRAQLVTVLWRLSGAPAAEAAYEDVPADAWYGAAARWAAASGLTEPGGAFAPDEALSREETALLLWRCAGRPAAGAGGAAEARSFADAGDIGAEALPAVAWALSAGLLEEAAEGSFDPRGQLTRAEAAVLLRRFDGLVRPGPLSLWREGEAKTALVSFVEAVTDPAGPDYIPPEDRIAVFDLDGTLFCETDPVYFDYCLLRWRVKEDPDYRDLASDFERETADKIDEYIATSVAPAGLELDHGRAVASAFAGMTVAEFEAYVRAFRDRPAPGYEGMTRGEAFYRPMVQVVEYLQASGFAVYVVSGTDRLIVRGLLEDSLLHIPRRQIIGSDETLVSSNQQDTDGLDYVFSEGDELILGGEFVVKNLKMNKVAVIAQEIGQQPVLSFGNSTGDSSMAEYVTSANPCRSLAFMLCCDDLIRENGSSAKAEQMRSLCGEYGWIPVSMRDDWTTVYGEGVTRKQ